MAAFSVLGGGSSAYGRDLAGTRCTVCWRQQAEADVRAASASKIIDCKVAPYSVFACRPVKTILDILIKRFCVTLLPQSPELAGGAGFTFGDQVAARYLACLLAEAEGVGLRDRIVCRVALEQRDAGEPLDDIIVDARAPDGSLARLSLQVKRELTISAAKTNIDFRDVIRDAWATLDKPGFRAGIDRVGAVTGPSVAAAKARTLQTLAELARASASTEDFAARFKAGGSASEEQIAMLGDLRTITRDLGRSDGDGDLHRLLSHFVLIKLDALHEGAEGDARTVDLLRQALRLEERVRANDLHHRIQTLARKGAGRARSWDVAALRRDLAPMFALAALPSSAPDLEKLTAVARSAAASIGDRIGPVSIQRPAFDAMVAQELEQHRFVAVRGLPGSGKSALLRRQVEEALAKGPALLLKADRLTGGGWAAFAAQLGLRMLDPLPVLAEIGIVGTPVLFIDGLDRIDKAQREIVVDLIRTIEEAPELARWRVLATLRDVGMEPVRTWLPRFFERGRFASLGVGSFDDAEARELGAARPELQPLLFGPKPVRDLVRRPFFAKILDEIGRGEQEIPRSETELLLCWWRRGGYDAEGSDARLRQRALLKVAQQRSLRADAPIPIDTFDTALLTAVEQLVADGVLEETVDQQFVRFCHDIFFEWSFAQMLASAGADWTSLLREVGEPPIVGRAVELHAQRCFVAEEDGWSTALSALSDTSLRSQWRRVWLLAPLGHPEFMRWVARFDETVFADDQRTLRQVLVWFQAQRTMPNPNLLNGTIGGDLDRDSRLRAADLLGWPDDFLTWVRFLSYLDTRISQVQLSLLPAVLTLYEVWQNMMADIPNDTSATIIAHASGWLAELEARNELDRFQDVDDRWRGIKDLGEFTRSLRKLVLRSARVERDRVAGYLAALDEERRPGRKVFEEVVDFSPLLSETHPHELVDFALRHLLGELPEDHRDRMLEEERRAAAYRKELQRKPKAERDRLNELALTSPSLGYLGPNSWDWDHLALERNDGRYFPASPTYEPFHSLFHNAPDDALRLVNGLTNHAVKAWLQLHRMQPEHGTPIPVVVEFPWGSSTFWGGRREYLRSRGLWAPYVLGCAFLALDAWALDQVGAGADPDTLIRRVVNDNASIAVLGIALNISLAAQRVSPVTEALVRTQRLWSADIERFAQEASIRSSSQIGFMRPSQRPEALAVEALNTRPVRGLEIRSLVTLHALNADKTSAERVRAAIRAFVNDLPFEYEEERHNQGILAYYEEKARAYAALGYLEHYRVVEVPGRPDQRAITFKNPVAEEPEAKRQLQESVEFLNAFHLVGWAERSFKQDGLGEELKPKDVLAAARDLDGPDLFLAEDGDTDASIKRGAVAAVASALVAFAPDLDPAWSWSVVERAALMPETGGPFWASKAVVGWHPCLFAARAFAAEIRRQHQQRRHVEALMSLATHPLECVAFEATRMLIGLWDVAPRVAWEGLRLALDLCIIAPGELPHGSFDSPETVVESRRPKLERALAALGRAPEPLPIPPGPWERARGRGGRSGARRGANGEWQLADGWWCSDVAGELLRLVPVGTIVTDPVLGPKFIEHCEAMLRWTIERTAPSWSKDGRDVPDRANCINWVHRFASVIGVLLGYLGPKQVETAFLRPICGLKDDPAFALLAPLTTSFLCEHVFNAPVVSLNAGLVLERDLDRLLAARGLQRGSYRAGELHGMDAPQLARWLMFVGLEQNAKLAQRFANGDWSEIQTILPVVDRFVRSAGWAPSVMGDFLTLLERARDHYPADAFADAILSILTTAPDPAPAWRGTLIAARLAARVQDLADRDAPLPLPLGQKLLRILDLLVDQGDRRSAALQLSPAFRDLRLPRAP